MMMDFGVNNDEETYSQIPIESKLYKGWWDLEPCALDEYPGHQGTFSVILSQHFFCIFLEQICILC